MSFSQKLLVRILLLVAKQFAADNATRKDIEALANHIACGPLPGETP